VINNTKSYFRKDTSTLFISSAAMAMLLSSTLLLSNTLLLQSVQAQTAMTFQSPTAAGGNFRCANVVATVTFDAQGTASSDFQSANITGGTFQVIYSRTGDTAYSGSINSGTFTNDNSGGTLEIYGVVNNADSLFPSCASQGSHLQISTTCSGSNENTIDVYNEDNYGSILGVFSGAVECSQGGGTTQPTSSMAAGSSQDSDRDGIPDSSDKCTHNSNPRCFKEGGDTSTTTTTNEQEQQPSSSSSSNNMTGNQTR
jgi:hypothetical protein